MEQQEGRSAVMATVEPGRRGGARDLALLIRSGSSWHEGRPPRPISLDDPPEPGGIRWFDLVSDSAATDDLFRGLQPICEGLTREMLEDLLTPDEQPAGSSYEEGSIKLASTFSVEAQRLEQKVERGTPQRAGVLTFQPVELLAGEDWLLTCWHPTITFSGADKIGTGTPGDSADSRAAVSRLWPSAGCRNAGDLGVMIMHELATGYRTAGWSLGAWHEDWELSLYIDDDLSNPDELPHLWGSMAVLRDWLNQLNRPGLRKDPARAWLPISNHAQVIAVDDRVDRTLDQLRELSNVMRSSFGVMHVQLAEQERDRKERTQHLIEIGAAVFLVPTLVVGFYGANTWVPGQGQHWGFYVMVTMLFLFSGIALYVVLKWRRDENEAAELVVEERTRIRNELLQSLHPQQPIGHAGERPI